MNVLKKFFSIKDTENGQHKKIYILGLCISIKIKNKLERILPVVTTEICNKKIIAVDGFSSSGSSAVIDYLSEFDNISILSKRNRYSINDCDSAYFIGEFKFFQDNRSILNIARSFKYDQPIDQDIAIKRFLYFIYECLDSKLLPYSNDFINFNNKFLKAVLDLDKNTQSILSKERLPYILEVGDDRYSNCSFIYKNCAEPYIFYKFKNISQQDFNIYVANYLHDFFNNIPSKDILVLDQMFSWGLQLDEFNFYMNQNPIKEIAVKRDPRDQYVTRFKYNFKTFYRRTSRDFIKFYSQFIKKYNANSKDRLLINFEDFILNHNDTANIIKKFLNIKEINHKDIGSCLDLNISVKNIGIYKTFHDQKIIRDIEYALKEYCYNEDKHDK